MSLSWAAGKLGWIVPEDQSQGHIRLNPTESQDILFDAIGGLRKQEFPVRIDAVKPRQVYWTTAVTFDCALQMYLANGAFRAFLLADIKERTEFGYQMHAVYAKHLAGDGPYGPRAVKCLDGDRTVEWLNTKANLTCLTAEPGRTGFGGAVNYLHATEWNFYSKPDETFQGLQASIANIAGTTIIRETTGDASGEYCKSMMGKDFEHVKMLCERFACNDQWELLEKGHWDGTYFPIFVPPQIMSKYRLDPRQIDLTYNKLTDVEMSIVESYLSELTKEDALAFMAWRRFKIQESSRFDEYRDSDPACAVFKNEFPMCLEDAFSSVGTHTVLDPLMISMYFSKTDALEKTTRRTPSGESVDIIQKAEMRWTAKPIFNRDGIIENRDEMKASPFARTGGNVLIYRTPESGWENLYCSGSDIAEGLEQGDRSTHAILKRRPTTTARGVVIPRGIVALYFGLLSPAKFAELIAQMNNYYYNCYSMGDYNKEGPSVVPKLEDYGVNLCPQPNFTQGSDGTSNQYWMRTTEYAKQFIVGLVEQESRDNPSFCQFRQFWLEAQTFVRQSDGKTGAEGKRKNPGIKNYDDVFVAVGEALAADLYAPTPYQLKPETRRNGNGITSTVHSAMSNLPEGVRADAL